MDVEQIKNAAEIVKNKAEIEISCGVNLDNIRNYSKVKVNYISIGNLTHSASGIDFSMLIDNIINQ